MKTQANIHLLRKQLEARLVTERNDPMAPPVDGWIRTLRTALGMSASQLARQLDVTKQAVANIERADREGTLSLTTYRKVAETLGCQLKVVLVPKKPLETIVMERARQVATRLVRQTSQRSIYPR